MSFSMRVATAISLCFILFAVVCRGTPVPDDDTQLQDTCSCPCPCSSGTEKGGSTTTKDDGISTTTTTTHDVTTWTEDQISTFGIKKTEEVSTVPIHLY